MWPLKMQHDCWKFRLDWKIVWKLRIEQNEKKSKAKIYFEHDMYSDVNEIYFNLISFNIFV